MCLVVFYFLTRRRLLDLLAHKSDPTLIRKNHVSINPLLLTVLVYSPLFSEVHIQGGADLDIYIVFSWVSQRLW